MRNIAYISILLYLFNTGGAEKLVSDQRLWYYKATGQAGRAPSVGDGRSDTIVYGKLDHGASSWTLRPRVRVEERRLPSGDSELRLVDEQGNTGPVVTLDRRLRPVAWLGTSREVFLAQFGRCLWIRGLPGASSYPPIGC
jgi:hypothetical protein